MGQAELLIAGLLVAGAGLSAFARRLSVPYPIVLVVGGAVVGFIPGLRTVKLDPQVVLVVFLPPLVYGTSIYANFGDLRANLRALTLSTVGLVLATMCAVAWAAHALIPGLPWAASGRLSRRPTRSRRRRSCGASTCRGGWSAASRARASSNDATALVAYGVAVAAAVAVAGSFSLADAGLKFVLGAVGGIAIGLAVGWIVAEIRKRTADAQVSVTISLLTGYAAFVPADAIGASGILATVTAGIYMGIRGPQILPAPRTRLQGYFVWDILDFVVNAILFVLIGLELRAVVDGLSGYSAATLAGYAVAVTGVVVVTRLVWFFTTPTSSSSSPSPSSSSRSSSRDSRCPR